MALLEFLIAAAGGRFPLLSGLLLCVAPGLALVPLLPALAAPQLVGHPGRRAGPRATRPRACCSCRWPAPGSRSPAPRSAWASVVLIAAGLALPSGREPDQELSGSDAYASAGLMGALLIGILLQNRVIGHTPVPGDDWAQYVLYADEIRIHGSLLIQNPFWMFGSPFRQDPGVPAVFGSYLTLGGQPASVLMHGIWVFAVMGDPLRVLARASAVGRARRRDRRRAVGGAADRPGPARLARAGERRGAGAAAARAAVRDLPAHRRVRPSGGGRARAAAGGARGRAPAVVPRRAGGRGAHRGPRPPGQRAPARAETRGLDRAGGTGALPRRGVRPHHEVASLPRDPGLLGLQVHEGPPAPRAERPHADLLDRRRAGRAGGAGVAAARQDHAAVPGHVRRGARARLLVGVHFPLVVRADGLLPAARAGAARGVRAHPPAAAGAGGARRAGADRGDRRAGLGAGRDVRRFYAFANPTIAARAGRGLRRSCGPARWW